MAAGGCGADRRRRERDWLVCVRRQRGPSPPPDRIGPRLCGVGDSGRGRDRRLLPLARRAGRGPARHMTFPILTSIIAVPLAGAIVLLLVGNADGRRSALVRQIALVTSLLVFGLSLWMWARFDPESADFQFVERVRWIPAFGIDYYLGVDGISLMLIVLTGFLTPIALLSSWEGVQKKVKE